MAIVRLTEAFPQVDEQDWRDLAARSIGAPDLAGLISQSEDGLEIAPIYPRAANATAIGRDAPGPWTIVQRIAAGGPDSVAAKAFADLDGGATEVELVFSASPIARGGGLNPGHAGAFLTAVGVPPALRIDAGEDTATVLGAIGPMPETALAVAFDPAATLAARGGLAQPVEVLVAGFDEALTAARDRGAAPQPFIADGRPWHDGGATDVQELAAVASSTVAYLRAAAPAGTIPDKRLGVTLTAGADEILTIAKFRAVRLLLARIAEILARDDLTWSVHAETSWRMMSLADPTMNMPRETVAAFAAGVGGASSITVLPHTLDDDDSFARRMARNTQLMLIDEAQVARVIDPGAGSGAIEALTSGLAAAAWDAFCGIEREGGIVASVRAGSIQRRVAAERERRVARVRNGEIERVGVTAATEALLTPDDPPLPHETAETAERLVFTPLPEGRSPATTTNA